MVLDKLLNNGMEGLIKKFCLLVLGILLLINEFILNLLVIHYGVIISLYVDDMLIFGTNILGTNKTKKFLTSAFKMKDLNEIHTILGIKATKHDNGFILSQTYYIEKLLNKYQYLKIKNMILHMILVLNLKIMMLDQ